VESLSDEQRVFIRCVEDILASTPGLNAMFLVETNPVHDLVLAIELADRSFTVRVNGVSFTRKRGLGTRFEWWVERRCRELQRLVGGDLRVVLQKVLTIPVSATLEAGTGKRWHRIGSRENGWLAFLGFLLPYGFLLAGESRTVFEDWFQVE
jgi:hypothetical protein